MEEIVKLLPQIFIYFALGFTYLKIFRYVNVIKSSEEHNHIVLEYLISGYILNLLWSLIPFKNVSFFENDALVYVVMIVGTFIVGFVSGKIYSLDAWDKFMNKLGVNRTRKKYLFEEMLSKNRATFLDLRNTKTSERYFGEIFICEEYSNTPNVVLYHYKHWYDFQNDDTMENFKENNDIAVLLNVNDFDCVIFQYEPNDKILEKE